MSFRIELTYSARFLEHQAQLCFHETLTIWCITRGIRKTTVTHAESVHVFHILGSATQGIHL